MFICKTLILLALVVWIGGLIFFAFVDAPTAFIVIPNTALAGNVVARSLAALHWIGIASAITFLVSSVFYGYARQAQIKMLTLANVLVMVMLALTLISQFAVTPRIRALRAQLPPVGTVQDPVRVEFDRMHTWSTRLEGGVLILGVVAVLLTARRFS